MIQGADMTDETKPPRQRAGEFAIPTREVRMAARMPFTPKPTDAEDVPLGTVVLTPLGEEATVIDYRGWRRDHRIRLVCRYLKPRNRRYDIVQLLPELVIVVKKGGG